MSESGVAQRFIARSCVVHAPPQPEERGCIRGACCIRRAHALAARPPTNRSRSRPRDNLAGNPIYPWRSRLTQCDSVPRRDPLAHSWDWAVRRNSCDRERSHWAGWSACKIDRRRLAHGMLRTVPHRAQLQPSSGRCSGYVVRSCARQRRRRHLVRSGEPA